MSTRDRGRAAADLQGGVLKDAGQELHAHRRAGQAEDRAAGRARRPRRPCRSTAATATSRSTRCAASTATRRSSPSARAPTRCSRWSSPARSAREVRRPLAACFFAAYAATLGLHLGAGERYSPDEAHVLLVAESIVSDGDVDLRDEYRDARGRSGAARRCVLRPGSTNGRLVEPPGIGFPLLVAPAYALGGAVPVRAVRRGADRAGVRARGAARARARAGAVGDARGAHRRAVARRRSAASTTIGPELVGGALLAGAALCALRVRAWPRFGPTLGAALLIAALPWLALKLVLPAAGRGAVARRAGCAGATAARGLRGAGDRARQRRRSTSRSTTSSSAA